MRRTVRCQPWCNLTLELERTESSECNGGLHLKRGSQGSSTGGGGSNQRLSSWQPHSRVGEGSKPTRPSPTSAETGTIWWIFPPSNTWIKNWHKLPSGSESEEKTLCKRRNGFDLLPLVKTLSWAAEKQKLLLFFFFCGLNWLCTADPKKQTHGPITLVGSNYRWPYKMGVMKNTLPSVCWNCTKLFCDVQMINQETGFSGNKTGTDLATTCRNLSSLLKSSEFWRRLFVVQKNPKHNKKTDLYQQATGRHTASSAPCTHLVVLI